MLRDAFTMFSRAVVESVETIGQTAGGIFFVVLLYVVGVGFAYSRRGAEGVKVEVQDFLNGLPALVLAFLIVLGWHLVQVPYRAYTEQRERAANATKRISELEAVLEQKRHALDSTDPAVHNMLGTIRAFMNYRRAIGPEAPCRLLITAHKDAARFAGSVIQFAVPGSNCPNGDLQNIGIRPEHVEEFEQQGAVAGKVVLHALPDTKGVDGLITDLSNLFQIQRSYKMPDTPQPIPENVIWLHFGSGAQWNTELFKQ